MSKRKAEALEKENYNIMLEGTVFEDRSDFSLRSDIN